jgi:hypothetical protein
MTILILNTTDTFKVFLWSFLCVLNRYVIKLFGPCFYLLGFGSFINFRYIAFDFHRICGHIHFERLSSLYNDIREDLDKQGYYLVNAEGKILEKQKGVVRTNCIDCLDRTNVTQVVCCLITTLFYDVHSQRERTLKLGI